MNHVENLQRRIETPRDRLAPLSEASCRISDSLDFESVLPGVLDSARSLTNTICEATARSSDSGEIQDLLASGMTQEERHQKWGWREGFGLFGYLDRLQGPLRLKDFQGRMRALGLSEFQPPVPVNSPLRFLTAPIRNFDEIVGSYFLGEMDRVKGFFAADDGEALVMFDSQADLVIASAKRGRGKKSPGVAWKLL